LKYDVQICRFYCILPAIESLILADDLSVIVGGYRYPVFVIGYMQISLVALKASGEVVQTICDLAPVKDYD